MMMCCEREQQSRRSVLSVGDNRFSPALMIDEKRHDVWVCLVDNRTDVSVCWQERSTDASMPCVGRIRVVQQGASVSCVDRNRGAHC